MKKILIADDNSTIRKMLNIMLRDKFDILEAMDGHATVNAIQQQKPDVVLLDVLMPGMNGFEVLRTVKENHNSNLNDIKFVMLTGCHEPEDFDFCGKHGADRYITKPFSPTKLCTIVEELF